MERFDIVECPGPEVFGMSLALGSGTNPYPIQITVRGERGVVEIQVSIVKMEKYFDPANDRALFTLINTPEEIFGSSETDPVLQASF